MKTRIHMIGPLVALAVTWSAAVSAQTPGSFPPPVLIMQGEPPFTPMGPGPMQLSVANLPLSILDSNLKLSAGQKTKIQKIQDSLREQRRILLPRPENQEEGQQEAQPDIEAMRSRFEKIQALDMQAAKEIAGLLTADQRKQLSGLIQDLPLMREAGLPAEILGELKLTSSQKRQIADIVERAQQEAGAKLESAQEAGDREAFRAAILEMRDKTHTAALAVLTTEQKAKTEKFLKEHPMRSPGGFGPPPDGPGLTPGIPPVDAV